MAAVYTPSTIHRRIVPFIADKVVFLKRIRVRLSSNPNPNPKPIRSHDNHMTHNHVIF